MTTGRDALRHLIANKGEPPLAEALLWAAMDEYPNLYPVPYLEQLDRWADQVARGTGCQRDRMQALLFDELGFCGGEAAFFDPEASLLNRVMDRRVGLPITLAVVYLEVAWRAGFHVEGVGFPGHFLVRHERVLIDPFHGGKVVSAPGCQDMLDRVTGGGSTLQPWMLAATPKKQILTRVLSNLKSAYMIDRAFPEAVQAIDRLLAISPDRDDDLRDRGLIYAELGCANAALSDLLSYLARTEAEDAYVIESLLPELRKQRDHLN